MPTRPLVRILLGTALVAVLLHGGAALGDREGVPASALYAFVAVLASLLVLARAFIEEGERPAWMLLGIGLALLSAADIVWWAHGRPAFLSVADALSLASYAALLWAIFLLTRARLRLLPGWRWLDGLVVGMTMAAITAAVVLGSAREVSGARTPETLIYPALDIVVIVLVAVPVGLTGWRPGRALGWLTGALATIALTDLVWAHQDSGGAFFGGAPLATIWLLAYLAMAAAAWQPPSRRDIDDQPRWREGIVPGVCGFISVGVLSGVELFGFGPVPVLLAASAAVLSGVRAALLYREHFLLLRRSLHEARVDALSGLPNRRALLDDLHTVCDTGAEMTLAFFDLDGFKRYNDRFGHAAGDALLRRLGARLSRAVTGAGRAYRLGGDEFCILLDGAGSGVVGDLTTAEVSLREHGEGFTIAASVGSVAIPAETREPGDALRIADQRMYSCKAQRRGAQPESVGDLLLAVAREGQPGPVGRIDGVAELAGAVGARLGLRGDELDAVVRGAQLYDVGMVAIPQEIVQKPVQLTDDEWDLVRKHTLVGERILRAAPGLSEVAPLVRASHERWDGGGYPDGLRGEQIPLGARVIAACDAYKAIVSDLPYAPARTATEAAAEVERCAGSQFDPNVAGAIVALTREQYRPGSGPG